MATKTPNPIKPKSQIIDNRLHFITEEGEEIVASLNVRLSALKQLAQIAGDLQSATAEDQLSKIVSVVDFIESIAGKDVASKLGIADLMPFFEAFSGGMGAVVGGDPGESSPSELQPAATDGN